MRRGCAWRSLPARGRAPCAPRGAFVTPHMLPAQLGRARGCRESSPRGRPVLALALPTQASHVTSVPSFPHEQDGAVSPPEDVTRTREPACRAASCLPSAATLLMPHPPPAPRPGCPFVCALSCATPGLHRRCDTLVPAAARPVPSLLLRPIQAVLARYSSVRISGTACRVPRGGRVSRAGLHLPQVTL